MPIKKRPGGGAFAYPAGLTCGAFEQRFGTAGREFDRQKSKNSNTPGVACWGYKLIGALVPLLKVPSTKIFKFARSPSPGASISHTKVWETSYAQIELFLELFPANVCLPWSAYGRNQRGKEKWLRKTDEGCGTSLWPPFFFQHWFRSYTDRSGDRSSRETHF